MNAKFAKGENPTGLDGQRKLPGADQVGQYNETDRHGAKAVQRWNSLRRRAPRPDELFCHSPGLCNIRSLAEVGAEGISLPKRSKRATPNTIKRQGSSVKLEITDDGLHLLGGQPSGVPGGYLAVVLPNEHVATPQPSGTALELQLTASSRRWRRPFVSDDATVPRQIEWAGETEWPRPARRWWRPIGFFILALLAAYVLLFAARVYARKYYVFLPAYLRAAVLDLTAATPPRPTHVFVLFTDHFEPDYDVAKVQDWSRRYAALAARHRDSVGRPPQHTFFYPGEQSSPPIYELLRSMTRAGLGEVELHFHHHYDTSATLRPKLEDAVAEFQQYGFLRTTDGRTQFAFIHGNSGLDNSNGDEMCGVTDEIRMLHGLGCFADFTFPSLFEDSQPRSVNSIYATKDDDGPKSYERMMPLTSLRDGSAEMMIFQGPLIFSPSANLRHLFVDLDDGDVHGAEHASPARVDRWIRANVHVPQRPDWVFVKLFAHGISTPEDAEACLGGDFNDALSYLEQTYNDGTRYVLHYITAREAYNLARAAAEGAAGSPQQYLDTYVGQYQANVCVRPSRNSAVTTP